MTPKPTPPKPKSVMRPDGSYSTSSTTATGKSNVAKFLLNDRTPRRKKRRK